MILDTGPALNFMASGHHGVLFEVLETRTLGLQMPETVVEEVARRARNDSRFKKCPSVLNDLRANDLIEILADDIDSADLTKAVESICGIPLESRVQTSKDLGEVLVMAHALVLRDKGLSPILLIDEWRAKEQAEGLGFTVVTTVGILVIAAQTNIVPKQRTMKRIYGEIVACDKSMGGWTNPRNPLLDNKLYGSAR